MANEYIFQNSLVITGSVTASQGFSGDGSGLTGITATAEWDGTRNGNAEITGSFLVSGSDVNVDFTNTTGVSGSFSGSYIGNGSGLTNLNINGYQASGSNLSGSFSGSFEGDGSGLTGLSKFPFTGSAQITGSLILTGSLTVSGSGVVVDLTNTAAISGSTFSGSFVGNGSGLTNIPATEWDGTRNGDAEITGSFIVSGSNITVDLLGDVTIDQNIEISNRSTNTNNESIAIGYQALPNSTIKRSSIAIGYNAGKCLTSGSCNIYIGQQAGCLSVKTTNNVALGYGALRLSTGHDVGNPTNSACNVAVGNFALTGTTTGRNNTAIGHGTLIANDTGTQNTAIGANAGNKNSSGISNVYVGYRSGYCNITRACNVFVGAMAGCKVTGAYTTAVGAGALQGTLSSTTSGFCNTALGFAAGECAQGSSRKNVYIGSKAGPSTGTTQNCQLYIGVDNGETPLIRGDFSTGQVTINTQVSASLFSGSFVGDGSGLTGVSGTGFPYNGDAVISGSLLVSQSSATGTAVTIQNGHIVLTQVSASLEFDSDNAAAAGGVPLGGLYRTGNLIAIRIT